MATSTSLTRAREHIEELCRNASDETALRLAVLDELRRTVGFDAHVWVMTDPGTWVGSAPLAEVPSIRELPDSIRLKYGTGINRWTTLTGTASLGDRRDKSPMWTEVMSRYGIADVLSSVYVDRHGCWGFLDLWRERIFDRTDCRFLDSIAEPVTAALRSCVAATFLAPALAHPRNLGPIVLILGNDLTVQSQTQASQEWLDALLPADPGRSPIPACAYNVAAQLLAREQGVDDHPPTARVHLGEGFWVTARAARLNETAIAVTLEETSPSDRLDLYARACELSAREAELLGQLATGGSTRQIAARMSVSENTVQDHLKSVFDKTGARNRTSLLGRALGVR